MSKKAFSPIEKAFGAIEIVFTIVSFSLLFMTFYFAFSHVEYNVVGEEKRNGRVEAVYQKVHREDVSEFFKDNLDDILSYNIEDGNLILALKEDGKNRRYFVKDSFYDNLGKWKNIKTNMSMGYIADISFDSDTEKLEVAYK